MSTTTSTSMHSPYTTDQLSSVLRSRPQLSLLASGTLDTSSLIRLILCDGCSLRRVIVFANVVVVFAQFSVCSPPLGLYLHSFDERLSTDGERWRATRERETDKERGRERDRDGETEAERERVNKIN
jgi:hypothetical protein